MPRAFSLEVPLGTRTFTVQELDGQGNATVDLLQSTSRQMSGVVVGDDGIANLQIPLRWHWEVHALDPGYAVCGYERQIWFHDALHGFVTFQVNPGVDPSLNLTDSAHIHGMMMATTDGGKTWAVANPDISTAHNDFRPTASGWIPNGYLISLGDGTVLSIGDNGEVVRSPDSGRTWETAWLNWARDATMRCRTERGRRLKSSSDGVVGTGMEALFPRQSGGRGGLRGCLLATERTLRDAAKGRLAQIL
jgi:hypothetical protein